MKTTTKFLLIGLGLMVSACSGTEIASRNTPFEPLPDSAPVTPAGYETLNPENKPGGLPSVKAGESLVKVGKISINVPRTLKVSEANRYLPSGDIVWRGDPIGDRHLQVTKIFETAMAKGVKPLNGKVSVDIEIIVRRFHAITEKARYTTGGLHAITFDLVVKNPANGELLLPIRTVRADLDAFGGKQALIAEGKGLTQKVRITNHLAEVIRQEMSNPKGYEHASLGFYQLMNTL